VGPHKDGSPPMPLEGVGAVVTDSIANFSDLTAIKILTFALIAPSTDWTLNITNSTSTATRPGFEVIP
jgi:hypothetical protein